MTPHDDSLTHLEVDGSDRDVATVLGLGDDAFRTPGAEHRPPRRARLLLVGLTGVLALGVASSVYVYTASIAPRSRPAAVKAPQPVHPPRSGPVADVLTAAVGEPASPSEAQGAVAAASVDQSSAETSPGARRERRAAALAVASLPHPRISPATSTPPAGPVVRPEVDAPPSFHLAETVRVRPAEAEPFQADASSGLSLTRQEPPGEIKIREERVEAADAIRLLRRR